MAIRYVPAAGASRDQMRRTIETTKSDPDGRMVLVWAHQDDLTLANLASPDIEGQSREVLAERIAILEDALRFYANRDGYHVAERYNYMDEHGEVVNDGGDRAKEALRVSAERGAAPPDSAFPEMG